MSEALNAQQLEMWNAWNSDRDAGDLNPLLESLSPLISSQVNRYSSYPVPRNVLNTHAALLARDAIEKYDPGKNTALGTHVSYGLKPLGRFVQKYSNAKYVPERLSQEFGRYESAERELSGSLGRTPTDAEVAKKMGMTEDQVSRIALAKAPEGSTSRLGEDREDAAGSEEWRRAQGDRLSYLRAGLKGTERKAFDMLLGRGYQGGTSNKIEVANKLGIDVSEVYAMARRWTRRLSQ